MTISTRIESLNKQLFCIFILRENRLWGTREKRNWPVNTAKVKICWQTLQIRGSLLEDTAPIILFIFSLEEREGGGNVQTALVFFNLLLLVDLVIHWPVGEI